MPDGFGPLAGLTVLDLSTIISGGTATSMLADLGAEVIKVEHPRGGDPLRSWAPFIEGESVWWKVVSRNKKSVTLNLSREQGQRMLLDLLARADALVENFRPGTLERWGLAPETLLARHPGLVVLRISGFGQTGPYRHRSGFGTVAEAMSGFVALNGYPDTPPLLPPMPLADEVAGLTGALSVLAAIHRRTGSGRGQVIDVSLYEPLYRLLVPHVTEYARLGLAGTRMGNAFSDAAPRNLYRSGDGTWIALSATSQRVFERLAAAIGRADLLDDERFRRNEDRARHREQLDAIIGEWMGARSEREILERLEESGAVAGPVYDVARIVADPHYAARENLITVRDPTLGDLPMVGVTPRFSETPGAVAHPGPALGEHNRDIYGNWLSLDPDALARLAEEGVV